MLATVLATAAAAIPAPHPPHNPYFARDPFNNIHNDTWMTDTYRIAGPHPGSLSTSVITHPPSLCGSLTFDKRGRILSVCPSTVSAPTLRMFDVHSQRIVAQYTLPNAPAPSDTPAYQNFTGGGYFFLDNHDRVWSATKTRHVFVIGEGAGGDSFVKLRDYDLTSVLSTEQRITSALLDFHGRLWFVSKKDGKVGVLNPRSRKIHVKTLGEEIENSFAIGRDGVYIASDKRMYRFETDKRGRPRIVWRSRYRNSGLHKQGQVDAGTGTTPTILPGGYVAITDNADPMDVVVYRTARRLRHGLKRVVCQVPVFDKGASATENSLLGSGRSLIVENNFGYQDPFDTTKSGELSSAGFARVDIARNGRSCRRVWTNTTVRAPTVVPKLSTKTQLVYTYTQDATPVPGVTGWSWVALSARTGREVFRTPSGMGLTSNNNYAGLALGPGGSAYLGTIGGLRILRNR